MDNFYTKHNNVFDDYYERWYVIGDIHGCYNQLSELMLLVKKDIKTNGKNRYNRIIFVGDYIDRGPNSYEVIEEITKMQRNTDRYFDIVPYDNPDRIIVNVTAIRGNHERMFLNSIDSCWSIDTLTDMRMSNYTDSGMWLMNGGHAVVESYTRSLNTEHFLLPPHHLRFFNNLEDNYYLDGCGVKRDQTWMVVHAGIDVNTDLEHQVESDYLWIRNPYINADFEVTGEGSYMDGKLRLVSGHTPVKEVLHDRGKVLLDTACVFGNKLTCCVFETNQEFKPVATFQVKNPVDYTERKH